MKKFTVIIGHFFFNDGEPIVDIFEINYVKEFETKEEATKYCKSLATGEDEEDFLIVEDYDNANLVGLEEALEQYNF